VPVIRETRDGERVAELMRWGLVPHWAKDESIGRKLNNARAEDIADKPSFRQAVRRRRCIIPASGFYEWQAVPATQGGGKQPWYVSPAADAALPFAFAGLFEAWRPAGSTDHDAWLLSCCIVTTAPNELMARIHDRMPVILRPEHWAAWLNRGQRDPAPLAPMLQGVPSSAMQAWPVSHAVNRGAAEGEALIEPLSAPASA
jgi:putative SOS response-associated peptidase YedK